LTAKVDDCILIVDDQPVNLRLLSNLLESRGYEVRAVTSGKMALTVVQRAHPDLILLDICMPEMDGFAVCQALKADPSTRDIPVIFVSALNEVLDKVRAFEIGGVDYITKPFHLAEVMARVETHLTLKRLRQQLQEQNERLKAEMRDRLAAEAALQAANQELERLASLDGLTQVANRRSFDHRLEMEWRRLSRDHSPLSLVLCDVDHFKHYNDYYGHQAGDTCLQQIARAIEQCTQRTADLVARYGGEEFAVVLPHTDLEGAQHIASMIQQRIAALQLTHARHPSSPVVTLSMGIASICPKPELEPSELVAAADRALYEAKHHGRDRYCTCNL
jgi:diguanylate cyclase (GGDEF)-like protein